MKTGGSYEGEWINGVRDGSGTHVSVLQNSRLGGKVVFTLASGWMIWPTVRVNWSTWTETSTKANGPMTWRTDMEHTLTLAALSTKESGKTISKMVMGLRSGLMGPSTKVITRRARRVGREYFISLMGVDMRESFWRMKSVDLANTSGLMGRFIQDNG